MVHITHEEARDAGLKALVAAGTPLDSARLQIDLLVDAELRGRASHGLLRLPRLLERIANKAADPVTLGVQRWRNDAFLVVEGGDGLGPVVACAAIDAMAERVPQTGVALAAVTDANHLGMIGWYAERYARRGFILLAFTISEALMHPFGGRKALIGTNPIAIGVPGPETPFVFDMATSLVPMGKIHDMALAGEPLQPGWAVDANGNPTLDAARAKAGAIAPFGGAKGYALGLAFELLVVALTGSAIGRDIKGTLDSTESCNKGDVFILVDPKMASGTARAITGYLDDIRASGEPGGEPVLVPGDRSQALRQKRLESGFPVPDALWEEILDLAKAGAKAWKRGTA